MNNLITIVEDNERVTVSARELHKGLEISERFANWFERCLQYGFEEYEDYTSVKSFTLVNQGAKRELNDFQITISMAKEICMIQRSEKGKQYRQYFLDIEKKINSDEYIMARALKIQEKQVLMLNNILEEMRPKAEFYDKVIDTTKTYSVQEAAKMIGDPKYGEKNLFKFLREKGVLMANNEPYQKYVNEKWFEVVLKYWNETTYKQTRVTVKGLNKITTMIEKGE